MEYTVEELINELKSMVDSGDVDNDTKVAFSYNFGDHWNSVVAKTITDIDIQQVEYSSYHGMDKIVEDGDDDEVETKLILS
jgi:hypothetical protein